MRKIKIRKKRVAILLLILILFVTFIVFCIKACTKKEEIEIEKKQTTFIKEFVNNTNEGLNDTIKSKIIDFFDIYYLSMKELNEYNMTYLFDNKTEAYINQSAMHFLINYRKMQRNDLTLADCSYNLKVSKILNVEDEITINILEDGTFNFEFMKDIDSHIYGVENKFVFKKENDDYKLIKYEKNADFYNIISANIGENSTKESIINIAKEALSLSSSMIDKDKNYYDNAKTIPTKKCDHAYNRENAYNYAITWITSRNPLYANFDNYGGNCQNYASQVLASGGIPNDVKGYYRFKYYSSVPDETEASVGRTPSWAGVNQFYTYAKYNQNVGGLCSSVDINYYYAEKGDLIQFGYKDSWAHTSVIVGSVMKDGKLVDLLTSSNTTDRDNFPLSAYNYPNKRLIKIYGWND